MPNTGSARCGAARRPPSAPASWRNRDGPGKISRCKRTFACRAIFRTVTACERPMPGRGVKRSKLLGKFAADLPPSLHAHGRASRGRASGGFLGGGRRAPPAYKIAVTGGTWEYLHNRLYFYNPFAHLEGQGLFTYIPLLDHLLVPQRDLRGVDAVVISRGRHANVRNVLDYCHRQSIPTIYMIDDNWFWVGKDWPDPYASIFAPGLPQYEMFLTCLRECDAVMVYNDVLAEDVRRHAKRVLRLPANVRPADFEAPMRHPILKEKIDELLAWRQRDRRASGGLCRIAALQRRGIPGPGRRVAANRASGQSRALRPPIAPAVAILRQPGRRAAVCRLRGLRRGLGALQPDILIAPLDRSRTSMSKCPIKYLDYSIAGAAGVYSDMPPYSQTIADGKTGLLVRGDDAASWAAAIVAADRRRGLRRSIVQPPAATFTKNTRRPWSRPPSPRPCATDRRASPGPKLPVEEPAAC